MKERLSIAFWSMYAGFCVVGTPVIWAQGAFDGIDIYGGTLLLATYLLCGYFIHLYVKKNSAKIARWFE